MHFVICSQIYSSSLDLSLNPRSVHSRYVHLDAWRTSQTELLTFPPDLLRPWSSPSQLIEAPSFQLSKPKPWLILDYSLFHTSLIKKPSGLYPQNIPRIQQLLTTFTATTWSKRASFLTWTFVIMTRVVFLFSLLPFRSLFPTRQPEEQYCEKCTSDPDPPSCRTFPFLSVNAVFLD